ncbi:MAG: hypothetical protein AAGC88_14300 [Bacteroidota bacterium]
MDKSFATALDTESKLKVATGDKPAFILSITAFDFERNENEQKIKFTMVSTLTRRVKLDNGRETMEFISNYSETVPMATLDGQIKNLLQEIVEDLSNI